MYDLTWCLQLPRYFCTVYDYVELWHNAKFWRAPIGRNRSRLDSVSPQRAPISAQCPFLAILAQNLAL